MQPTKPRAIESLTREELIILLHRAEQLLDKVVTRLEAAEKEHDDIKNRLRDLQQR
jgi:hypothetical protein